jgi:hypothetical protein
MQLERQRRAKAFGVIRYYGIANAPSYPLGGTFVPQSQSHLKRAPPCAPIAAPRARARPRLHEIHRQSDQQQDEGDHLEHDQQ